MTMTMDIDTRRTEHAADAGGGGKASCDDRKCLHNCAARGIICPAAALQAGKCAQQAVRAWTHDSRWLVPPGGGRDQNFTFLSREDIVMGEKLGQGGFSNVHCCWIRNATDGEQEFAVKYLKRKVMLDPHLFKLGAADLAVEACFLDVLNHPNIVTLYGITAGSVETNFASGQIGSFFIVVDRLVETLEQRLDTWRQARRRNGSPRFGWLSLEYKKKRRAQLQHRIEIALDIASVMQYLHSLGIVFRDLKPDNIGFDKDGILKIFDFGMAKELKSVYQTEDGKYKLTGNCGSMRYMAPEVAREAPYNQSVDVYSFGILLWELCSSEKAFDGYSCVSHLCRVVFGAARPPMDAKRISHWPANLVRLMQSCWDPSPLKRPSFDVVREVLKDILDGKEHIPISLGLP